MMVSESKTRVAGIAWCPGAAGRAFRHQEQAIRYRAHAKDIGRMGLRLTRCYDLSAEHEYHACVDGALLCDYIGEYSIRSLSGSLRVVGAVGCPDCRTEAVKLEEAAA